MRKVVALVSMAALLGTASIVAGQAGAVPTGYTIFTCKEGVGAANTNAHCVPKSEGKFGHEKIGVNQEVQLKLEGLGVQHLAFSASGIETEIQAEGFECADCMVENVEEAGEKMAMTSLKGHLKFFGLSVTKPAGRGCKVKSSAIETEAMKYASTATGTVAFAPVSGTTIAKFELEASGPLKCPVGSFTLTGSWAMTPSGATWVSNVTRGEEVIKVNGNVASLSGEATAICEVTPDPEHPLPEHNPVALTPA